MVTLLVATSPPQQQFQHNVHMCVAAFWICSKSTSWTLCSLITAQCSMWLPWKAREALMGPPIAPFDEMPQFRLTGHWCWLHQNCWACNSTIILTKPEWGAYDQGICFVCYKYCTPQQLPIIALPDKEYDWKPSGGSTFFDYILDLFYICIIYVLYMYYICLIYTYLIYVLYYICILLIYNIYYLLYIIYYILCPRYILHIRSSYHISDIVF